MCTDCHLSKNDDNNAIMAQLLMQGTNYVNFIGRYCWVAAGEHGLAAVVVTERDEPQAVIGSSLHQLAYPEHFASTRSAADAWNMPTSTPAGMSASGICNPEILSLQARGEFLYAACGEAGLRIFDIAFIDHKGFSERIVTAPVSPLGQRFFVRTKYATAVAAPATTAPDPTRTHKPENREQAVHALYAYIYVIDKYEGTDPGPRRHAAGRQPAEQFPGPGADLQSRWNPPRGDEESRSSALMPTSPATPGW